MELIYKFPWEVSVGACANLGRWALPLQVDWHWFCDVRGSRNRYASINILCFHLWIDVWKWSDKLKPRENEDGCKR